MKSPIKRHSGLRVRTSQIFGANPQLYSKFKDSLGNPLAGHNGVDLVLGQFDTQKMYGSNIFSISDGEVIKTIWDNPMSSKRNGIYIKYDISPEKYLLIIYWMHRESRKSQEHEFFL